MQLTETLIQIQIFYIFINIILKYYEIFYKKWKYKPITKPFQIALLVNDLYTKEK